ncbi:MAG: ornithine--oxo-acid transaminase [Pseudomonadota bacterium]
MTQRTTAEYLKEVDQVSAHNYHPLPVVLSKGEGCWVWDVEGRKYLDLLSAYSAVNQGHRHPKIIQALKNQADRITLTSRAFQNDQMGPFLARLCEISGYQKALPMNTGAEAVETALKAARKWGYVHKKIPEDKAEIIVCAGNFHGRTITIVSFSTEELYKQGFGPITPGFRVVPFGDALSLEAAINHNTCAVLIEPIQCEAGVNIPPDGYLKQVREITKKHNILFMADEIQTGLGRTGKMFACEHENVRPDVMIVGKALGGGVYPVSAIMADDKIMDVFGPGTHGSTFGGNPLGAAVGLAALNVLVTEKLPQKALEMGAYVMENLGSLKAECIQEIRGRGLIIGIEIKKSFGPARPYCEQLMQEGLLAKETHDQVIRICPPLVIDRTTMDWALERIRKVITK